MIKIFTLILFMVSAQVSAQSTEVIDVATLESKLSETTNKIQVFNFWATWCGPCIKELPYFESVQASMSDKIDVNLITVDFVQDLEKVNKFIARKGLKSNVYLIDNVDYNSWIDKVDTRWSGAIPATLIINPASGERKFVESELKEGELEKLIEELN